MGILHVQAMIGDKNRVYDSTVAPAANKSKLCGLVEP